jgi:hypothetical protein
LSERYKPIDYHGLAKAKLRRAKTILFIDGIECYRYDLKGLMKHRDEKINEGMVSWKSERKA